MEALECPICGSSHRRMTALKSLKGYTTFEEVVGFCKDCQSAVILPLDWEKYGIEEDNRFYPVEIGRKIANGDFQEKEEI